MVSRNLIVTSSNMLVLIVNWELCSLAKVGDNQRLLQSLKDSPYYKAFEDKASIWEKRLADLDENLMNLNQVQRKWVYLEPIFGRGALPKEQGRFRRVDDDYRLVHYTYPGLYSCITCIVLPGAVGLYYLGL